MSLAKYSGKEWSNMTGVSSKRQILSLVDAKTSYSIQDTQTHFDVLLPKFKIINLQTFQNRMKVSTTALSGGASGYKYNWSDTNFSFVQLLKNDIPINNKQQSGNYGFVRTVMNNLLYQSGMDCLAEECGSNAQDVVIAAGTTVVFDQVFYPNQCFSSNFNNVFARSLYTGADEYKIRFHLELNKKNIGFRIDDNVLSDIVPSVVIYQSGDVAEEKKKYLQLYQAIYKNPIIPETNVMVLRQPLPVNDTVVSHSFPSLKGLKNVVGCIMYPMLLSDDTSSVGVLSKFESVSKINDLAITNFQILLNDNPIKSNKSFKFDNISLNEYIRNFIGTDFTGKMPDRHDYTVVNSGKRLACINFSLDTKSISGVNTKDADTFKLEYNIASSATEYVMYYLFLYSSAYQLVPEGKDTKGETGLVQKL